MDIDSIAYQITVTGRVQGVAFRYNTQIEAEKLGLVGMTRNQIDGTVFIKICGLKAQMMDFLSWCQNGPSAARVDKLEYEEIELFEQDGFKIIR